MAKNRAPKRRRPTIDPFDLAIVTGAPLPATFSHWRAAWRVEHPRDPGLINGLPSLADVWADYHGRPMTDTDAAAIVERWPEVEAATKRGRDMRQMITTSRAPGSQAPQNWPADQTTGFVPVARTETDK